MGIAHRMLDWIRACGTRREVPPEQDLELLDGLDGCETAYLSLDERHAVDRLVASGHARLEPIVIIGARQFNRLHLKGRP